MVEVYLIALAGASCSGKTTIAKHLQIILGSNAKILHQDDFAPAAELIPMHPEYGVQDWDDPVGAIDWARQRAALKELRRTGRFPPEHESHDAFNEQIPVPISSELETRWREKFRSLEREKRARRTSVAEVVQNGDKEEEETVYILADGFLMLYDAESVKEFDVKLLVREDYETLKKRRDDRSGYHTAVESEPAGTLWRDPPRYWEEIVWPAYIASHQALFVGGDVQAGKIDTNVIEGVVIVEASGMSMDEMVNMACEVVYKKVKSS